MFVKRRIEMIKVKSISIVACLLGLLLLVNIANADLNLIGEGTSVHGTYNLIYDTDLNVTWYDYTNTIAGFFGWQSQVNWASSLSVNFGGTIYDDWRLPTALNQDMTGPCSGYNCIGSEMGHLFYTELGNAGDYDTSGNWTGCGSGGSPWCLTNKGDFQNLQSGYYWSGTVSEANSGSSWLFDTHYGDQFTHNNDYDYSYKALAVRPGLAVVPEPISSILFITGGATLGLRRFRKKITK